MGEQSPPTPSTQPPLCLPMTAKIHLACNCVPILHHSKRGLVGMKLRLVKWHCPKVGDNSPEVLQGEQKALFAGMVGQKEQSLSVLVQSDARKGKGRLSLENEAETGCVGRGAVVTTKQIRSGKASSSFLLQKRAGTPTAVVVQP